VTVLGVVLLAVGQNKVSDADKQCPERQGCSDEVASLGNEGRTLSAVGGVGIGLGLVAVAGGVVWYLLADDDEPAEAGTWIQPVLGPSTAGLSLTGTF
jgi:hypothetical protein